MILVLNRQPRLSGNKLFLLLVLLVFSACSVTKKSTDNRNKDTQIVKAESELPKVPEKVKDKSVDPKDIKVTVKVDTISWKKEEKGLPPIKEKDSNKETIKDNKTFKESYNIKLLIPLNSDGMARSEMNQSRFVHFYAGFLMGLEILDEEDIKLNVKVFDTEEAGNVLKDKLESTVNSSSDLIIGPFDREDVKLVAEECKKKEIPMISPWQTSTKITNENPFYIQMKPNLKEHFYKLASTTCQQFSKGEVAIIGKNNKETRSWIKYFQESAKSNGKDTTFYSTYFVTDDSLSAGPTAFIGLMKDPKIKAVILPNYSYYDEEFIYSCLRRLMADKASRSISVYGMPILYDSERIDFDYYHALQLRIVMSDFVDENQAGMREFRRKYLEKYGEIPTVDAVKGYDLILYTGRNIWKYGRHFQNFLEHETGTFLQTSFDIKKAKSDDSMISNDPDKFDYYENKHLDIIEFKGTRFQRRN